MVEILHFQSVVSTPQISFKKQLSVHRTTLSWRDSLNVVGFVWFFFLISLSSILLALTCHHRKGQLIWSTCLCEINMHNSSVTIFKCFTMRQSADMCVVQKIFVVALHLITMVNIWLFKGLYFLKVLSIFFLYSLVSLGCLWVHPCYNILPMNDAVQNSWCGAILVTLPWNLLLWSEQLLLQWFYLQSFFHKALFLFK